MKIGIIGSGAVGQTLGKAFLAEDHEVMLGTRNTEKPEVQQWAAENAGGKTGTFKEAAAFAEMLVLCTAGHAALEAINLAGKEDVGNKVVIDAVNPIAKEPPVNGVLKYFTDINYSLMEELQKQFPSAKFVKAFNSVGNALMYQPALKDGLKPSMFICGNDSAAKKSVSKILEAFGWETEDMGTAEAARAIEPLAMLWCIPGFVSNDWMHAFKVLRP